MKSFFRVSAVVIFVLQLAVVVETQRPPHCPSCNIRRCENETVLQESCPEAQLVWDTCVCCKICGSRFGEPCGGAYGYLGTCEYGLDCTVEPSIYLSGTNISGECSSECNIVQMKHFVVFLVIFARGTPALRATVSPAINL